MTEKTQSLAVAKSSKSLLWIGRIVSALPVLFLLMDAVMKLIKPPFVVQATVQLGYPESVIRGLGIVLLICTLLYVLPQTAILGAILLTGYLGGAVASHVRAGQGPLIYLSPILFGVFIWVGLLLRDAALRSLLPVRSQRFP